MNKLVFLTILVYLAVSQTPNCHILPGQQSSNVVTMPDEIQVYKFQHFVEGFNLRYEATGADESSYKVINPFYITNKTSFPDVIGKDFTFIDFSLETDDNLAWIQRGAFLASRNSDKSIFVASGSLNEQMNIQINNTILIGSAGNTICFNVITLSEQRLLLDCQMKQKQTDILYILNEENNSVAPHPFTGSVLTNERKSVALRLVGDRTTGDLEGGRVFIFSAWIGTGLDDQSQVNNTKIEIYSLSKFVPYKVGTITAADLKVDDLSISDITVDALGNIYVSDIRGTVIMFTYDGEKVTWKNTWKFSESVYKVSVDISTFFVSILQAVGETQIFEVDLDEFNSKFTYQLPENSTKVVNFLTSNDLLIVQTENFYYVYKRYFTQIDHIIAVFSSSNSRAVLSPRSPNAVFLDAAGSSAYFHSEGFFIIKNPTTEVNETITVKVISGGYNGLPEKNCQFEFNVKPVTDVTKLYNIGDMPSIVSYMETSVRLEYDLYDYFLGSKLQYNVSTDSDLDVSLQVQDEIKVLTNYTYDRADWLGTFEDTMYSYYKVIVIDNQIVAQHCVYKEDEFVECTISRTIDFSDKIFKHSFFRTAIDTKTTLPVLAYITESNKRTVNFLTLTGNLTFNPQVVDDTFNATDVDGNSRYLYVLIRDAKMIRVYKNDFNLTLNEIDTLDASNVQTTDPDFVFSPSEAMLSPVDVNTLIIKNLDGILIFRANAFRIEFITEISVPHLEYSYVSSEIIVGQETMLIIISDNSTDVADEIFEYSIYDLRNPFKLRSINLIDKELTRPVTALYTQQSSIVGLKTHHDGNEYLTFIQMSRPQVGSVLSDIPLPANLLSLVKVGDVVIGENIQSTQQGTSNLMRHYTIESTVIRLFQNPKLTIKASLDNSDFKNTKTFQLNVTSLQRTQPLTQIINLYNVRSFITESSTVPEKIEFPKNSNGGIQTKLIKADDYFLGPVCQYTISCPICGNNTSLTHHVNTPSMTLKDHITLLSEAEFNNVRGFYYFTNKSILWSVTSDGIYVTDENLKKLNFTEIKFGFQSKRVDGIAEFGNKFVIYVYNEDDNVHNLVTVSADSNLHPIIESVIPIINNPGINAVQLIKTINNRIFILDNKLDTTGKGEIFVITSSNDGGQKFTYEYTITSNTFGLDSGKINDFELIQVEGNSGFFLASLSDYGVVFGSFDGSDSVFQLNNPSSYSFNTDTNIQEYQISGTSAYLQLEIISKVVQPTYLHLTTLLTVSNGQHLEFYLNFNKNENGFQFDSIDVIGQFDKYGRQSVINWAQGLVYQSTSDNFILIGHRNSFEISLGLYSLFHKSSEIGHEKMIGAVETKISHPVNNDFSALLFRVNNEMRVVVSTIGDQKAQIFNLSKNVFITYQYNERQDFNTIRLTASNAYASSSRKIDVSFDSNPIPPSGGLAWYIILVIVLGVLAIVGIGVFLFIRYKRKQGINKDSLLSVSKAEEEDEEI